jgi:hypothetical protein
MRAPAAAICRGHLTTSGNTVSRAGSLRQVGGRTAPLFVLLLQKPDPLVGLPQFLAAVVGEAGRWPSSTSALVHPVVQAALEDPEVLRDLVQRGLALADGYIGTIATRYAVF